MEYKLFRGKCMQRRMYYFVFKVHINVIISVCLYCCFFCFWFVYWSNRNCNGVHIFHRQIYATSYVLLFLQVHIIVIISVCLYFCLFLCFWLCTGAIGIAMEYMCFISKCMQTRGNDFAFQLFCKNRMCLPLHLNMFQFVVC